ncbi:MAG: PQQ-binding-like beta-propeller repeat protein, partial [Planctomycetaceae bacterium]
MQTASTVYATLLAFILVAATSAAPPIGWRNDGTGKFPTSNPPINWAAEENIVWRTVMSGRSLASPIIVGDRVFVTAEPAELICLSTKDGKRLWQRSQQYMDVFEKSKAERIEKNLALARDFGKEVGALHRERDAAHKANDAEKQKEIEERIRGLRERITTLTVFPSMPGGDTANTGSTPTSDGKNVFAVFGTGIVSSHTLSGERNWIKFVEAPSSGHCASPLLVDGKLIVHL